MNKTWIFIGSASVIMVGIMVFLTIKGVSRREHTFIKWSSVEKVEAMGLASMQRLFPLLKPLKTITIAGNTENAEDFITGFQGGLSEQNIKIDMNSIGSDGPAPENLVIDFKNLDMTTSPGSCSNVPKVKCLYFKAQRGWLKKERDRSRHWFLLQWIENNHFYLFYTNPTQ